MSYESKSKMRMRIYGIHTLHDFKMITAPAKNTSYSKIYLSLIDYSDSFKILN